MERKVGEIFEYNGEWYQCVQGNCEVCDFSRDEHTCLLGVSNCVKCRKNNDCKAVAFKKLEKVGEPHEKRVLDGSFPTFQKYKVYNSVILPKEPYIFCNLIDGTIEIEIKQNKEDMEEKKIQHYDCFFDREPSKSNLKPFDLEAAKAGKPVYTRDGRKARIICFDAKRKDGKNIVALIPSKEYPGFEDLVAYPNNGNYHGGHENDGDLMMLPEKKEGWVNIYNRNRPRTSSENCYIMTGVSVFETKEGAISYIDKDKEYIDTVKIEWEE